MDKVTRYFTALEGARDWAAVQPLFDDAFHPDCVIVTADGEYDKERWAEMAASLVGKGATVSGFEVTGTEGDSISYKLTITVGEDAPLHMAAKGTLRDGRLVRVEPVDPTVYSTIVERSR